MKKLLALTVICFFALTLSACVTRIEMPEESSKAPETSEEFSEAEKESVVSEAQPIGDTSIVITDIHKSDDDNPIYNFNITYQDDNRYYSDFEYTDAPAVLVKKSGGGSEKTYDAKSAVEYAYDHWDDGMGLCAPFLSRCLLAGGITEYTDSSTSIALQLLFSKLGFGQFLPINADRKVKLPDYAAPGDIVQVYCYYEGMMIHSLIYVGNDFNGDMRVCCHNFRNDGTYAFEVDDPCYDCYSHVAEVFFYHFYNENDKDLPVDKNSGVILYEKAGYMSDAEYDRNAAISYAIAAHGDGLGEKGALRVSKALNVGGVPVCYPNHSAVFFQLVKSRLGSAETLPVNPNRTVTLPAYAEAGDVAFVYCPEDGIFFSSFIIGNPDENGNMTAYSYDLFNSPDKPFRIESTCPGCGAAVGEVALFHFN